MDKIRAYIELARLHKPIGTLLLMWPTLWALWLAKGGIPDYHLILIFVLGVLIMRSAGCVINDYADRKVDGSVERTKDRPLASGRISEKEALGFFCILCLLAFVLVLLTDMQTIMLSFVGLGLAVLYPFMKRYTHLPQLFLGLAFSWAIPMAYSAQGGSLADIQLWMLFAANAFWTIAYDTYYAMVDRDDDINIGIKSTAILFGKFDLAMILFLQGLMLSLLMWLGVSLNFSLPYYLSLFVCGLLFFWQFWQARNRERTKCFKSFLDNNLAGACVFLGFIGHYFTQ